jgi:hypothetical protein
MPHYTIIIQFLCDVMHHILGWRWENVIQGNLAAATMHWGIGTSCAISLLAKMNAAIQFCVVTFQQGQCLYSSSIVIDDWGNFLDI